MIISLRRLKITDANNNSTGNKGDKHMIRKEIDNIKNVGLSTIHRKHEKT